MAKPQTTPTDPTDVPLTGMTPESIAMIQGFQALVQELRETRQEAPMLNAQAFEKVRNPSNVVSTGRSVFNPRGTKLDDWTMPELKCEIHAPWKIHPAYHGLDREEVELFNLLEAGEYVIELNDQTPAKVAVRVIKNDITGKVEKMHLDTNWSEEHKGKYPAMRNMLRQMLGKKAESVWTMKEELALIKSGDLSVSV